MRDKGLLVVGSTLILIGILIFFSNVFNINFWAFCWPIALILLGIWLLFQPRLKLWGADVNVRLLGNILRRDAWIVSDEEIFIFVGDARFDLTQAEIPTGETTIRIYGFVGDVKITLPEPDDIGFSISSMGFVNDTRILDNKRETFLTPVDYKSEGYESSERKVRFVIYYFVIDLDVYPA